MIDALFTQEVQLGIDIATSATIIGAMLSWFIESRRQAKKSRERGISDQARASSLSKVQSILYEFENSFSDLIASAQTFERPIDNRSGDRLGEYLRHHPEFIDVSSERLGNFYQEVDRFYESIQKRRYSLLPVLDSLHSGDKFMYDLKQDIQQVGELYNKLNSGWSQLLREFHAVYKEYYPIVLADENHNKSQEEMVGLLLEREDYIRAMLSILLDKSYWTWVESFVPKEMEEAYKTMLETNERDAAALNRVAVNFTGHLLKDPYRLFAQILRRTSVEVQTARIECKDILIKLSALTHKLLSNQEVNLDDLIKKYETEDYLGKERFIH
ncbi:hypothetical protein KUW04_03065 [Halomonas denitrificans]|nr:hypothetical protein [Halomonas denitrificans]